MEQYRLELGLRSKDPGRSRHMVFDVGVREARIRFRSVRDVRGIKKNGEREKALGFGSKVPVYSMDACSESNKSSSTARFLGWSYRLGFRA